MSNDSGYSTLPVQPSSISTDSEGPEYRRVSFADPANYDSSVFPRYLQELGHSIPCKVLICITIYNENSFELQETIRSICLNAERMRDTGTCSENVVIAIVQDGLEKLDPTINEYGKSMGIFDLDNLEPGDENSLHCFAAELEIAKNPREFYPKMYMVSGFKHVNRGKINSHRWFFKCFATHINPKYCVLVDCGTIPSEKAIYLLVDEMERWAQVGGACGEIRAYDPKYCHLIEISQDIEYRVSHFMDKSLESLFGFVTVLPGAFCAYRWEAINGDPLDKYYFYSYRPDAQINCWRANMFLAEDQLLGTSTILRPGYKWILSYVEKAKSATDVPTTFPNIMQQRRRWINGSRFAFVQTLLMFGNLFQMKHSCFRKLVLVIYITYFSLNIFVATFAPVIFLMYLYVVSRISLGDSGWQAIVGYSAVGLYGAILNVLVFISLQNKSVFRYKKVFLWSSWILGVLTLVALGLTIYQLFLFEITGIVILYIVVIFFTILICAFVHGHFRPLAKGITQYLFMLPCYLCVYMIYAFCNIHDVSWGIRNDSMAQNVKNAEEKARSFRRFRNFIVLLWYFGNVSMGVLVLSLDPSGELYVVAMTSCIFTLVIAKTVGSLVYSCRQAAYNVNRRLCKCPNCKKKAGPCLNKLDSGRLVN